MSYKASVSNIYELLDEDGGVTPQANVGGEDKRVPTKKVTPAPAKAQAKPKQEQQTPKAAVQQQQKAPRQERSIDRRPPREFSSPKAGEGEVQKERRVNREGGERRFERGGRGGFAPRGNKRTFDRRSGTGRGKEDKKGGAGKGNWGTIEDDQKVGEEKQQQDEKAEPQETQPQGEQAQPAEGETPKVETKEPEEEEDKTRTLDEFFKTKPNVKVDLPKPRQAGEGVSDEWKGFVALKKKEEDEVQGSKKEEKKKESKKEVVPVNEVFKVQEEQRQRRERPYSPRGGRGGKRGGGSGKAPFVQDEASFPSLSTKA